MKRKITYEIENCFECPFLMVSRGIRIEEQDNIIFRCEKNPYFFHSEEIGSLTKSQIIKVLFWIQSEKCPLEKS